MAKNCSRCNTKHIPPFGSRCKKIMAVIAGFERDDPNYLSRWEDEFCLLKKKEEVEQKLGLPDLGKLDDILQSLSGITDRIGKLEVTQKSQNADKGSDTGTASSPASLLTAPLTKLTGEEEDQVKLLRPEHYSQLDVRERNRDPNKLNTVGLFHGWICVAMYLMKNGGNLTPAHLEHLHYASGMLNTRQFYDQGAVKYDRMIVDKFLEGKSSGFKPDPVIASLTFSSKIIPDSVELCPGASLTRGVSSFVVNKQARGRKRNMGGSRRYDEVPPDFPQDICFFYNYRQCHDESCTKSHTCRKCQGKHRAETCREKTRRF